MPLQRISLSGIPGGEALQLTTGNNILHTTGINASIYDAIYLYLYNTSTTAANSVTLLFDTTQVLIKSISARPTGLIAISEGLLLSGTGSVGRTVVINPGTSSTIYVIGYVNRIS